MLCNKARESLADTNARFVQFREVLLAMEGTAGANGLAAENSLLRVIRARGNRILQKAGHNHMLAMAVLRNRLLLPDAEIALVIIKGDEYALLRGTAVSPGGTTAPPTMDGGRSTVKLLGSRPQGRRPTVYQPVTTISQAAAINARPGSRQQQSGSAAGRAATPHQLRERLDQDGKEQAAHVPQPDARLDRDSSCD